ncbi:hypothetical protein BGAL_1079g00020 [Botrytis galanthina]|uniref:Uncharacterized protein n=1 Tax=Botrytis galanthina TaxID=278940 RepID=A0A4V4HT10_9HELO|nr:hypothetical protein BGAL_1079g00020 [Botrytis galanthina]
MNKKGFYGEPLRKQALEKAYKDWVESEKERNRREETSTNRDTIVVSKSKHTVERRPKRSKSDDEYKNSIGTMSKDAELMIAANRRVTRSSRKTIEDTSLSPPPPSNNILQRPTVCDDDVQDPNKLDGQASADGNDIEGKDLAETTVGDKDLEQPVVNSNVKKFVRKNKYALLPPKGSAPPKFTRYFKYPNDHLGFWELPGIKLMSQNIKEINREAIAKAYAENPPKE